MIAVIDWFPIALLGLGFLTGLSVTAMLVTPKLAELNSLFRFWRQRHARLQEDYSRMEELANANARLAILLRNKLAERDGEYHADDSADSDWWKTEGGSPFSQD